MHALMLGIQEEKRGAAANGLSNSLHSVWRISVEPDFRRSASEI